MTMRTREQIERLDAEFDVDKEALVDIWGGWKHRRWQVFYDQPDKAAMAQFCKETGLRQSRRSHHKVMKAISPPPRNKFGRDHFVDYLPPPCEAALQSRGLVDHPRAFNFPHVMGRAPGAVLFLPYEHAIERLDPDRVEMREGGVTLHAALLNHGLRLRLIAHAPYNQQTIGILVFSSRDNDLLARLQATNDYVFPV